MKRLRKNKFFVLTISVAIVSLVYFGAKKAIDNYDFQTNSDIVTEDEQENEELIDSELVKSSGLSATDKTDLVLEETEVEVEIEEDVVETSAENNSGEQATEERKIYVYITGEVNNPGVVILREGSRIVDAINSAGGTTIKANISKVNLVYVLEDGMKVNIPNDSDLKNNTDFEYITMSSGDGGNDNYSSNKNESSGAVSSSSASSEKGRSYNIININTATQTELESLPGIGPSLALKIINYRKENGKFSSIEEIKNVSGIGESKFEDLKGYITF